MAVKTIIFPASWNIISAPLVSAVHIDLQAYLLNTVTYYELLPSKSLLKPENARNDSQPSSGIDVIMSLNSSSCGRIAYSRAAWRTYRPYTRNPIWALVPKQAIELLSDKGISIGWNTNLQICAFHLTSLRRFPLSQNHQQSWIHGSVFDRCYTLFCFRRSRFNPSGQQIFAP